MIITYETLREIKQQSEIWLKTLKIINEDRFNIIKFLEKIDIKNRRIVFTGAGTSEFVGNTIKDCFDDRFSSIATTDIVSNPNQYFKKDDKILLVSFARSGNSPESLASVELLDQIVDDCYHLFITCNKDGKLAINHKDNSYLLLMPEESNDKGFAMTSSFTSMMLSALTIFNLEDIDKIEKIIKDTGQNIEKNGDYILKFVEKLINLHFKRLVYLGSNSLKYLSQEASLKFLELTAGNIPTMYDSPLGFRHGPKSIVDNQTLIILMLSNNQYTRKYEMDILKELSADEGKHKVAVIDSTYCKKAKSMANYYLSFKIDKEHLTEDIYNSFLYIYVAQLFAFYKSLKLDINPDNPCPTGEVNRVVQGVKIYDHILGGELC